MVAIGLLDIPPKIHLQITEFVETRKSLKALSVTSRSLRSIAQSKLFEKLQIDIATEPRGSIDDLLANPRICAAIRFLELRGRVMPGLAPHDDVEQLSPIQKILPEMVGLREVTICRVNLSKAFLDVFLGIAANMPLQITLEWNIFPYIVIPMPHIPLQISHLNFVITDELLPSLELCRSILHASATTITGLRIEGGGDGLMKLADVDLPFLHDLILIICDDSRTSAAAFLTAQRAIRKLKLSGTLRAFPTIPPNALPNLRELKASTELVNQLVPGRPVEAIEVRSGQGGQDWFGEAVGQSTVRVRKLRVHPDRIRNLDTQMLKRMVTILPFLESLWLPVWSHDTVHKVVEVLEVLTSLKCLKDLRFDPFCLEERNFNHLATKLRNANSSFSFLEVQGYGATSRESTICIWNEVFGVFHQMETVSARYN